MGIHRELPPGPSGGSFFCGKKQRGKRCEVYRDIPQIEIGPQGRERPLYTIISIIPKKETHQANQDGTKDHQGQKDNAQAEGNEGHKRGHHITLHISVGGAPARLKPCAGGPSLLLPCLLPAPRPPLRRLGDAIHVGRISSSLIMSPACMDFLRLPTQARVL